MQAGVEGESVESGVGERPTVEPEVGEGSTVGVGVDEGPTVELSLLPEQPSPNNTPSKMRTTDKKKEGGLPIEVLTSRSTGRSDVRSYQEGKQEKTGNYLFPEGGRKRIWAG